MPRSAAHAHVQRAFGPWACRGRLWCEPSVNKTMFIATPRGMRGKAQIRIASFPGSRAWAEKKEPGTHCLRMLSSPRISGNLEISRKTCSVTLTSARHPDFSRIKDACH